MGRPRSRPEILACSAPNCGYVSTHRNNLRQHVLNKHSINFKCFHCGVGYSTQFKLRRHLSENHPSETRLVCPVADCDYSTMCQTNLARHKKNCHNNESSGSAEGFSCPEDGCPCTFSRRFNLRRHLVLVHGKETSAPALIAYTCIICEAHFTTKQALDNHMCKHRPLRVFRFACPYPGCERLFRREFYMRKHRDSEHTGKSVQNIVEPRCLFACTIENCQKQCLTRAALQNHVKTHSGVKPPPKPKLRFVCAKSSCALDFATVQSAKRHYKRRHAKSDSDAGEEVVGHPCSLCELVFDRSLYLDRHLRIVHSQGDHKCPEPACMWTFHSADELRMHCQQRHEVASIDDSVPVVSMNGSSPACTDLGELMEVEPDDRNLQNLSMPLLVTDSGSLITYGHRVAVTVEQLEDSLPAPMSDVASSSCPLSSCTITVLQEENTPLTGLSKTTSITSCANLTKDAFDSVDDRIENNASGLTVLTCKDAAVLAGDETMRGLANLSHSSESRDKEVDAMLPNMHGNDRFRCQSFALLDDTGRSALSSCIYDDFDDSSGEDEQTLVYDGLIDSVTVCHYRRNGAIATS